MKVPEAHKKGGYPVLGNQDTIGESRKFTYIQRLPLKEGNFGEWMLDLDIVDSSKPGWRNGLARSADAVALPSQLD